MLVLSFICLVIAMAAAFLDFTGLAGAASNLAELLFFAFTAAFLISLSLGQRPGAYK